MANDSLIHYWYQALASEHGIEVVCSDPNSIRSMLYVIRKEAHDTDLDQIKLTISPFDPGKLWLVKKEPSNETA